MAFDRIAALIVGLAIAFYWSRVLQMAIKTRRRTGNAANFLPPERLGRLLRIIWIPSIAAWIIVPLFIALQPKRPAAVAPLFLHDAIALPAALLVVLCLCASWICWKRMGKSWRMGINPGERTQLIVSGPYAYVRHPIYALSTLMMLASMAAVPAPLLILAGLIHITLLQWESRREERYLIDLHGEVYSGYRRQVGRFIPLSHRPFRNASPQESIG
jgi:protein-S-isoprenylcysteine O-methyltransferase Ste14